MSRSQPTPTNPATRFFDWRGGEGKLVFYDKEKQENINVPLPFEFLVLDELATITGYSDQDQSGFWSNEVRSIGRDELTVRTKKGTKFIGVYKDLKGNQAATGARYAKSIYIAYKTREGWVIGNIKAHGAALTAWIEFSSQYRVQNGKVVLSGASEAKKGSTTYWIPTFEYKEASSEEDSIAIDLDRELQNYLNQYLSARPEEPELVDEVDMDDLGKATPEQLADFEERKAAKKADKDEDAEIKSLLEQGEPFDDSQIPF